MAENKQYQLRISVMPLTETRNYANVSFSDDVKAMFSKEYLSVKRMQDRLAFVPWDNKTGYGTVAISGRNIVQFGLQNDCDKMMDFCGEYDIVNRTDNGVVFVKLEDRRPLKKWNKDIEERFREVSHDPVTVLPKEPPVITQAQMLSDALRDAIENKETELRTAEEELDTALALAEDARRNRDKVEKELLAYKAAYEVAKGVGT